MDADQKQRLLRRLWRERMHTEPGALERAPRAVRARFDHVWAPSQVIVAELARLPGGALAFWLEEPRGHLLFAQRPSCYRPGQQPWRDATLDAVCDLALADVAGDLRAAMLPVYALLDHLFGSRACAGQPSLSDGAGATLPLAELAERFQRDYALGYAREALQAHTPAHYLAATAWLHFHDPQQLEVLDPLTSRWHRALWSEAFWRRHGCTAT